MMGISIFLRIDGTFIGNLSGNFAPPIEYNHKFYLFGSQMIYQLG
jgi:hypothetical protein